MNNTNRVAIVVVAAGRGVRAGAGLPKQYRDICGQTAMTRCLRRILATSPDALIQVVIHPEDRPLYDASLTPLGQGATQLLPPTAGGDTRQASAHAGLEALFQTGCEIDIVLIHDVARIFLSSELALKAISSAARFGAAVPACLISDTVKKVDGSGRIGGTPDRDRLRTVQTPQAFRFDLILDAHRRAASAGIVSLSDDAAVAGWAGYPVETFEGDPRNMKLTTASDFADARARIQRERLDVRVGQGFDVHAFGPGDHLWLGGVRVPHERTLEGHSDADVVLHAVTDAILACLSDGDIGAHFPPSDPQWRGAPSSLFVRDAMRRLARRDGLLAHLDVTIVCEEPRIGPWREEIRSGIAGIAGIAVERVSVKATTTERLGFTGRREGIAAMAIATVRLPLDPGEP